MWCGLRSVRVRENRGVRREKSNLKVATKRMRKRKEWIELIRYERRKERKKKTKKKGSMCVW